MFVGTEGALTHITRTADLASIDHSSLWPCQEPPGTGFLTRMPTAGFYVALVVSTVVYWWAAFAIMAMFVAGRAAIPALLAAKGAATGSA